MARQKKPVHRKCKIIRRIVLPQKISYNNQCKRQIIMRLDTRLLQPFTSWSNSL